LLNLKMIFMCYKDEHLMKTLPLRYAFFLSIPLTALAACGDDASDKPSNGTSGAPAAGDPLANAQPVVDQYAKNVHANYAECLEKAQALKTAIDNFVAAPSQGTLDAAKAAWIAARLPYGPSEVYRFYGGPIDDEDKGVEGEVNSWPLDEN